MSEDLTNEQKLYNRFIENLLKKFEDGSITPKELEIVMKFLDNNNIQASTAHKGVSDLVKSAMELPFDGDDESPIRRVK
jgi:hypothetical protein